MTSCTRSIRQYTYEFAVFLSALLPGKQRFEYFCGIFVVMALITPLRAFTDTAPFGFILCEITSRLANLGKKTYQVMLAYLYRSPLLDLDLKKRDTSVSR